MKFKTSMSIDQLTRFSIFISLVIIYGCNNSNYESGAAKADSTVVVKLDSLQADKQELAIKNDPNLILNNLKEVNSPVDIGQDRIQPLNFNEKTSQLCGAPIPKFLGELNEIDKSSSIVTKTTGIDLSLWGISAGLGRKDVLIISNFITYKDYECNGGKKRVSVGMQIYIHAISKTYKVKTADIKKLAAAVELGYASADYHLHIFGLTNANDIYKNLPGTNFDVDSYSKIVSSFDGLVSSLSSKLKIDPIVNDFQK